MSKHFFRTDMILSRKEGAYLTYREDFPGCIMNPMEILASMLKIIKKNNPAYKIIRITTTEIGRDATKDVDG